jgi:parallel beta-helix repeat protein
VTTWYLDYVNGSDANNGTSSATPKQNLSSLTVANGDTVLFAAGITHVLSNVWNIPQSNVTVSAYGLVQNKPTITHSVANALVVTSINRNNTKLSYLRLYAAPNTTARPAFQFYNSTITNCTFSADHVDFVGDDGAALFSFLNSQQSCSVTNCTFTAARAVNAAYGGSGACYMLSGTTAAFTVAGLLIDTCTFNNNPGRGLQIVSGQSGDAVGVGGRYLMPTIQNSQFNYNGSTGLWMNIQRNGTTLYDLSARGFDGILVYNNQAIGNANFGMSIGPTWDNAVAGVPSRKSVVRLNSIANNCASGTTGNLQLNGCFGILVERNVVTGAKGTGTFDGCNIFLDIMDAASPASFVGCSYCTVRGNTSMGANTFGGTYAAWVATAGVDNSTNPPSSGVRILRGYRNTVENNILTGNGAGVGLDKAIDNTVQHNTIVGNGIGIYEGVGAATRNNTLQNNILLNNNRDLWGMYSGGGAGIAAMASINAAVTLSQASPGQNVTVTATGAFSGTYTVNFAIREVGDTNGTKGYAIVQSKTDSNTLVVTILRAFTSTSFTSGQLSIGSAEPFTINTPNYNCRYGATDTSLTSFPAGANDVTTSPGLGLDYMPTAGSPTIGAGTYVSGASGAGTRRQLRPNPPTMGAYERMPTRTKR